MGKEEKKNNEEWVKDPKIASIMGATAKLIGRISPDMHPERSPGAREAAKYMAKFRHNAGSPPGEDPELFGWFVSNIPEDLRGKGSGISKEEKAIFTTLSLYPGGPAPSKEKISLGSSVGMAGVGRNRLAAIETANDIESMRYPLRALTKLLASKGARVNYPKLAADLYKWQYDKISTSIKWERDYASEGGLYE